MLPQILNKSVGWASLWGMVYTYLPGVLVCYCQLVSRRPAVRLPGWLKAWMDGRKQLGLLSLAASEHRGWSLAASCWQRPWQSPVVSMLASQYGLRHAFNLLEAHCRPSKWHHTSGRVLLSTHAILVKDLRL